VQIQCFTVGLRTSSNKAELQLAHFMRTLLNGEVIRHLNVYDHKDEGRFLTLIHKWVLECEGDVK
jgi:hypothetical protein